MPKSKKSPMSDPGTVGLILLAGLPISTAKPAAVTLQNRLKGWRVKALPFSESDADLYVDPKASVSLLRDACDFAEVQRGKSATSAIPRPSRIILCYVHAKAHTNLLTTFGFSVFPVPVVSNGGWKNGKSWRFNIDHVVTAFTKAIEVAQGGIAKEVQLRIQAKRSGEVLLLPSRNYILPDRSLLSDQFDMAMNGKQDWTKVGSEIVSEKFTKENFGRYYAKVGGNRKNFCVDNRGLVFANSSNGRHGPARQLRPEVKVSANELKRLLEALYRFGTPVLSGFQHDVQLPDNKFLNNEVFACAESGYVTVSGDHANVYTNDVVREA